MSFVSPSGFVLPRRTVTSIPSPAASGDVGPPEDAHLAPTHPRHEEQPCDHRIEAATLDGDLLGLDAAAATLRPRAGNGNMKKDPVAT